MNTELTILETPRAITVFDKDTIAVELERVRKEAGSLVADVNTAKGRADYRSHAHKVSQWKTHMVGLAEKSIEAQAATVKAVRVALSDFKTKADAIRDETKKPAVDWDANNEARKDVLKSEVSDMRSFAENANKDAKTIEACILTFKATFEKFDFQEYSEAAKGIYDETLETLDAALVTRIAEEKQAETDRIKAEDDAKELAELKADKLKRDAADAKRLEEDNAKKAEDQRKADELEDAQEAEAKAKRDRDEAKQRDAQHNADIRAAAEKSAKDAEQRVRDDIAAQKKKDDAAAKVLQEAEYDRKANLHHRTNVRIKAAKALSAEPTLKIDSDQASIIIQMIEDKLVPNVTLNF